MMVWICDRTHEIFEPNLPLKLLMLTNVSISMHLGHYFCIAFDAAWSITLLLKRRAFIAYEKTNEANWHSKAEGKHCQY